MNRKATKHKSWNTRIGRNSRIKHCKNRMLATTLILFFLISQPNSLLSRAACTVDTNEWSNAPLDANYWPTLSDCTPTNRLSSSVNVPLKLQHGFSIGGVWVEVTIDQIDEIDDLDSLLLQDGDDFYAKITIDGNEWTSSTYEDNDHPKPGWTWGAAITKSSVDISIEVWEDDWGLGAGQVDISPKKGTRTLAFSLDVSQVLTQGTPIVENKTSSGSGSDFRGKITYTVSAIEAIQKMAEIRSALYLYYAGSLDFLRTCGRNELSARLKYESEHIAESVSELILMGFFLGTPAPTPASHAVISGASSLANFGSTYSGFMWEAIALARYCTMWGPSAYGCPLFNDSGSFVEALNNLSKMTSQEAKLHKSGDIKGLQVQLLEELTNLNEMSEMKLIVADAELLDEWVKFTETCDTKYSMPPGWKKNEPKWWEFWVPDCEPKPLFDAQFAPSKEVIQRSRDIVFVLQGFVSADKEYVQSLYDSIKDYKYPVELVVSSKGLPEGQSFTFQYGVTEDNLTSKTLGGGESWNSSAEDKWFDPGEALIFKVKQTEILDKDNPKIRYIPGLIQSPIKVPDSPLHVVVVWKKQLYFEVQAGHGEAYLVQIGRTPTGWYDANSTIYAGVGERIVYEGNGTRYVFKKWTGDASGDSFALSDPIVLDKPKTAAATWDTEYSLEVSTRGLEMSIPGPPSDYIMAGALMLIRGTTNVYKDSKNQIIATGISDEIFYTSWFPVGTKVSIDVDKEIYPFPGWRFLFTRWLEVKAGGETGKREESFTIGTTGFLEITMDEPKEIFAEYKLQAQINFTTHGLPSNIEWRLFLSGNRTDPVAAPRWFDYGTQLVIDCTPKEYSDPSYTYEFDTWRSATLNQDMPSDPSCTVMVTNPDTLIAVYESARNTYNVTIQLSGLSSGQGSNIYVDGMLWGYAYSGEPTVFTFYTGDVHSISSEKKVTTLTPGTRYRRETEPVNVFGPTTITFNYVLEYELKLLTKNLPAPLMAQVSASVGGETKAADNAGITEFNDDFLNGWTLWLPQGTILADLKILPPEGYVIPEEDANALQNRIGTPVMGPIRFPVTFEEAPDFVLKTDSFTKSVPGPGNSVSFEIELEPLRSFSGSVYLTVSGLPPDVAHVCPESIYLDSSKTATITLTPEQTGEFPFTLSAAGDGITHSLGLSVIATQESSFTLAIVPTSLFLPVGGSRQATLIVQSVDGYRGSVNLELPDLPDGMNGTLIPTTVDLTPDQTTTSRLILTADDTTQEATYHLEISGEDQSITRVVPVEITLFQVIGGEKREDEDSPFSITEDEEQCCGIIPFSALVVSITIFVALLAILIGLLLLRRKRKT